MGILTILTLIFLTLKLAAIGVVATWSWFWVLSPMITEIVLSVIIIFLWKQKQNSLWKPHDSWWGKKK